MDELYAELPIEDDKQELEEKKPQTPRTRGVLILDISPRQENEYQL